MRMVKAGIAVGLAWTLASAAVPAQSQVRTVPAGAQIELLLQTALNSGSSKLEDRFEATNLRNYEMQGQVVLAPGVMARGFVSSVKPGKAGQQGQLTLSFDELRIGEQALRLRASIVSVLDPKGSGQVARLGPDPAVVDRLDRGSVPLVGVLIGTGGTLLATNGSDVKLPIGVVLRIRLDRPIDVPVTR